ncbi:hypothetical protein FOCC_FOCC017051 [Frankliniella occidentalis]|nr:hypothetical protein FOCC_FOCC017051 [Frankliniella occidentalis]
MATTFTTASPMAAVTAALLLAVAISSPTAVFADKSSESSEGADSKENRSSVSARQLFGFGTGRPGLPGLFGSSPFGFGNNGFPFGGGNPFFNGLPDGGGGSGQFNNNPFLNGQTGNAPFHNNNPSISGDPSGNPYPTNVPTSGASGGPVRPRPDQTGNQYNTGRPFGSGGVQNGNQYTTSRPFGSGGAQNDNQYNSGRPFGSGDVDVLVDRVVVHPGYDPKKDMLDDIALVHLEEPVAFSESAQPVCLPIEAHAARYRPALKTVVGWRMLPDNVVVPVEPIRDIPKSKSLAKLNT